MYKRNVYDTIKERMSEPRRFVQVIMGPRQIGKSTVVKQVLDDLDRPFILRSADTVPASYGSWISDCWAEARLLLNVQQLPEVILAIDEIQKIRNWSESVKKEWDSDTLNGINIKVILLGSSRVMLEKGLSESMMGRFEEIRMAHWTFPEMRDAFGLSLDEYIYFGGYPGAAPLIKDEQRWRDYISASMVDATINKDILMDTPIGKPALLRQTFELCAAYSGRIVSLTKLLGALQDAGNTVTLAGYINLLGDSGLITGLQKFSADTARRKASIPKYQVFNNALCSLYSGYSFNEALTDRKKWGVVFESAIGAHIVNSAFSQRFNVHYWRDSNNEVDFILSKNRRVVAVEVNSNDERATAGLQSFKKQFHPDASFIVGSNGIAPETFLSMNLSSLFDIAR